MTQYNKNNINLSNEPNDSFKKTTLADSAEIYEQRHDEDSDIKKTWHNLGKKEKWQFFKDYYLLKILISIIACSLLVYILAVTLGPHTQKVFYAAILQDDLDSDGVSNMENDLSKLLKTGKHETVFIDTSFNFSEQNSTLSGSDKLTTIMYSELIDVIVSSPDNFKNYAYYGYLKNLSEYLPNDILNNLSDCLITAKLSNDDESTADDTAASIENDTTAKEYVFGIDLTKSEKYMALNPQTENPVLSIAYNSPNKENTFKAIRYLFDLTEPSDEK